MTLLLVMACKLSIVSYGEYQYEYNFMHHSMNNIRCLLSTELEGRHQVQELKATSPFNGVTLIETHPVLEYNWERMIVYAVIKVAPTDICFDYDHLTTCFCYSVQ